MMFRLKNQMPHAASPVVAASDLSTISPHKIWIGLIVVAGVLLRLYRLDVQSLWADEGLQYFVASAAHFSDVLDRMDRTFHPPLSFLVSHVFLKWGDPEVFLRLPSALLGIGSLLLCYVVAKRLTSPLVALFAMLVLAVSPFHIWYSQDGRMYAQLLFLSLLSTLFLLRALEGEQRFWWFLYALGVVAGMYTHVFMGLSAMVQCLWVWWQHPRARWAYCASGLLVALLCLPLIMPWLGYFLYRVGSVGGHVAAESGGRSGSAWAALPYTFFVYGAGFSLGPSVAELHEQRSVRFLLQYLPSIVTVGVVFGSLLVVGMGSIPQAFWLPGTSALSLGNRASPVGPVGIVVGDGVSF